MRSVVEDMKKSIYYLCLVLCLMAAMSSCSSFVALERDDYSSSDSAFISYIKSQNIPYTKNNHIDILNGAHVKFDSLLADIAKA